MANELLLPDGTKAVEFGQDGFFDQMSNAGWDLGQQNKSFYDGLAGQSFGQNGTQDSWWGDTFKSFDNLLPTIGGLASMYMQWDKLQAEKNKARDAHNANAKMYNNQLVRANNLGKSIYGDSYKQDQTHVKKSTV